MKLFRWTLILLIVTNLWVGALMFLSPDLFGQLMDFPVLDAAVMRGYGERIALLGVVYIWVLRNPAKAGALIWIPLVDEVLNVLGDTYELVTGGMAPEVVGPMLGMHALFALLLAVSTKKAAARPASHRVA